MRPVRPYILPLLAFSFVLPIAPAKAQAVDVYGYDAAGRYHTDNYGSSPNLRLNTSIDVSDLRAKMEKLFARPRPSASQPWYNDYSYRASAPAPPPPRVKTYSEVFMENIHRKADAGDREALAFLGRDALYFGNDFPKAVSLLQKASDAGDRPSTDLLYHLLLDKEKGVQDIDRAGKLLPLLADWGQRSAQDTLGRALITGDRFPKDVARGLALREAACRGEGGGSALPYDLAADYESGNGIPPDTERAIHWYTRALWYPGGNHATPALAAKLGVLMLAQKEGLRTYRDDLVKLLNDDLSPILTEDRWNLSVKIATVLMPDEPAPKYVNTVVGRMLIDVRLGSPRYALAAQYLEKSRDPAAMRMLGLLVENGQGVERDHEKALSLFHKAAEGDDGPAYYYLALDALTKWQAAKQQPEKNLGPLASLEDDAQRYAAQGARCGDARAKCLWGQWLQHQAESWQSLTPEEKTAQFQKARRLWQEADAAGVNSAAYYLGNLAEKGEGVPKDLPAAVQFFRRSSDAGYPLAQQKLALLMLDGKDGVAKDPAGARVLLEKAAVSLPSAANAFGVLLWHSPDGTARASEVQKWLQQSFDSGYWPAGRNLAKFWHTGFGGRRDEVQAHAYLEKMGTMGGSDSAKIAADSYLHGDVIDPDPAAAARWKAVAGP